MSATDDTLAKDIDARVYQKLSRWLDDAFALYEIAELSREDAVLGAIKALSKMLTGAFIAANIEPRRAGELIADMMRRGIIDRQLRARGSKQ